MGAFAPPVPLVVARALLDGLFLFDGAPVLETGPAETWIREEMQMRATSAMIRTMIDRRSMI